MRITIVPAGPKTSAATIRQLLNKAPASVDVYGVYRNISKVPAEFLSHKNFHAVRGDIEDASSLDLSGSDAVMTSTPPFFSGEDPFGKTEEVSNNVKGAVEKAGRIKRLMLLSSMGAEFAEGVVSVDICGATVRWLMGNDRAKLKRTTLQRKCFAVRMFLSSSLFDAVISWKIGPCSTFGRCEAVNRT